MPHRLVADVDSALEQEILDIPQAQREEDMHHHQEPDHLRRGVEIAERAGRLVRTRPVLVLPFNFLPAGAVELIESALTQSLFALEKSCAACWIASCESEGSASL